MDYSNLSHDELLARLAKAEADNIALSKKGTSGGIKVSSKGGVSVYGLGRFPVTLYKSQWETLLGKGDELKAFIAAHADELATKAE